VCVCVNHHKNCVCRFCVWGRYASAKKERLTNIITNLNPPCRFTSLGSATRIRHFTKC
jgi:hypothetical protein